MKKYNIANYNRLKADIKATSKMLPGVGTPDFLHSRDDLIVKYMPLVENLARKFSTSQTASGTLSILDLIQYGYIGLINAVDKIDVNILIDSDDAEKTIKSFVSKRVKGAIRRSININRGDMKIPEYKLNEIHSLDFEEDKHDPRVILFFNQVFQSTDEWEPRGGVVFNPFDKPDDTPPYNIELLNKYLLSIMKEHLNQNQYDVLRLFYGLDETKMSAIQVATYLGFSMSTANVRVSQIKKSAIDKLIKNVDPNQIFDII